MTTPPVEPPPATSAPPPTQPPHAPNPPTQQTPVVVNADHSGLNDALTNLSTMLRALPESVANAVKESTPSPASPPPPTPGTTETTAATVEKSRGAGKVASWFFGMKT